MSTCIQEQVERQQLISSREHAWYNMIRAGKEARSKVDKATPDIS